MNRIEEISIKFIPHDQARYPTVGDWFFEDDGKKLVIAVSKMEDERHQQLVAVHELIEVLLCRLNGVTQESVDAFDMAYENARQPGDESEPGDDPQAPYKMEHSLATSTERMLSATMGVDWKTYEDAILALFSETDPVKWTLPEFRPRTPQYLRDK